MIRYNEEGKFVKDEWLNIVASVQSYCCIIIIWVF